MGQLQAMIWSSKERVGMLRKRQEERKADENSFVKDGREERFVSGPTSHSPRPSHCRRGCNNVEMMWGGCGQPDGPLWEGVV